MNLHTHPRKWPNRCGLDEREECLPASPGIYAVLDGRRICYIGKSKNLSQRWRGTNHHRYEQASRKIGRPVLAWFICSASEIHDVETHLINHWKNKGQAEWNNTKVPDYGWGWARLLDSKWFWFAVFAFFAFIIPEDNPPPKKPTPAPKGYTNLYTEPDATSLVTVALKNGASLTAELCQGDWVRTDQGWVEKSKLSDEVCDD